MPKYRFAMVGAGWRAGWFLRVVRECPELFAVTSALIRDKQKAEGFTQKWGIPACGELDALLETRPDFVVLLVPRDATPDYILALAGRGVPVLAETPPARDIPGLEKLLAGLPAGARVEVAEQYQFQPMHAALLALVRSGLLGTVRQVQVSCAHGYHGISLIRKLLGLGFEAANITAFSCSNPLVRGLSYAGTLPKAEEIEPDAQTIAFLDFGGKQAVFDFAQAQYMSYIRGHRMLVRGERGEVINQQVSYLKTFDEPMYFQLARHDAGQYGNLEGYFHQGIAGGGQWYYRNPFAPARLTDDEIAVATCLQKMGEYARGGPSFYSLREAAQDQYLDLLIQQAENSGQPCRSTSFVGESLGAVR